MGVDKSSTPWYNKENERGKEHEKEAVERNQKM